MSVCIFVFIYVVMHACMYLGLCMYVYVYSWMLLWIIHPCVEYIGLGSREGKPGICLQNSYVTCRLVLIDLIFNCFVAGLFLIWF